MVFLFYVIDDYLCDYCGCFMCGQDYCGFVCYLGQGCIVLVYGVLDVFYVLLYYVLELQMVQYVVGGCDQFFVMCYYLCVLLVIGIVYVFEVVMQFVYGFGGGGDVIEVGC